MTRVPKVGGRTLKKATAAKAPAKPAGGGSKLDPAKQLQELKGLLRAMNDTLSRVQKVRDRVAAEIALMERGNLH